MCALSEQMQKKKKTPKKPHENPNFLLSTILAR